MSVVKGKKCNSMPNACLHPDHVPLFDQMDGMARQKIKISIKLKRRRDRR